MNSQKIILSFLMWRIRGDQYKLIYFYTVNEWELYDLKKDPGEQHNLMALPQYQATIKQLKVELNKLRDQYDDHEPAGELNKAKAF